MKSVPCLLFGEILFDCFPDGSQIPGGAPFNVAWHLRSFGIAPALITRVGRDAAGRKLLALMASHGMNTGHVQEDALHPTGTVAVHQATMGHVFEILPEQAYDHIAPPLQPLPQAPAFLYHGSLAIRNAESRNALETIKISTACPVFLDVNLRPPWWNRADVLHLMTQSTWVKVNEEELALLAPEQQDTAARASALMQRARQTQMLIVTRGAEGSLLFTPKGHALLYAAAAVHGPEVDSVGAGDAFCAVFLLGISQGWAVGLTMHRAQEFAAALIGRRGATVEDPLFHQDFLKRWENDQTDE
ncbi:MAG: carbohydrate kinase family protein [Thermodesulfobacteriota bacterium]